MAVTDLWAFGTLLIAAFGLGTALLSALSTPSEDRTEFAALAASAGLGAMGVLLGLLGLFGSLHAARFLIPLGAATTLMASSAPPLARHGSINNDGRRGIARFDRPGNRH